MVNPSPLPAAAVRLLLLPAVLLGASAAQAQLDEAALRRCAQITDPTPRLACFDGFVQRLQQRAAAPAQPAPAAAAAAAAPDPRRVAEFGRPARPDGSDVDEIETYLPGPFAGWSPRQRFTLANGQVWEVTDDSSAFSRGQDVRVKVRRGVLGSYFIEFANLTRSPRVKRVE